MEFSIFKFKLIYPGQTAHARRSSDWLNPNLWAGNPRLSIKVSERNQADAASIPDIEISNWSENEVDLIKEQSQAGSPPRPSRLELGHRSDVCVETLSTPEISGLRTSTWSHSPTRTFVRNFP